MRFNFAEMVDGLASVDRFVASKYNDWTDSELWELHQERIAIMQHDGGLSAENADKESRRWLISLIGDKRFNRIDANA